MDVTSRCWTAIVLTCQNHTAAQVYQKEIEILQRKGVIDDNVLILTVEDPKEQVGSGGASLNAILVVTEHLGARLGHTVVSPEVLKNAHILIMHTGRRYPYDPCGRAFTSLPLMSSRPHGSPEGLASNIILLLETMTTKLAVNSPPGVWICSTDMFLDIPHVLDGSHFLDSRVAVCISTYGTRDYARNHGVYKLNSEGLLEDIVYRGSAEAIETCVHPNGMVPLVSGVLYFPLGIVEILLMLTAQPPLDACTYMGLDSGARPIQMSVFFDILNAMSIKSKEEYTNRNEDPNRKRSQSIMVVTENARETLWKQLHQYSAKVALIKGGRFSYMDLSGDVHHSHMKHSPLDLQLACQWSWQAWVYADIKSPLQVHNEAVIINSVVGKGVKVAENAVVSHCHLPENVSVAKGCILSGFHSKSFQKGSMVLAMKEDIILQNLRIKLSSLGARVPSFIVMVTGRHDDLQAPFSQDGSTFCNAPWAHFFLKTGVVREDLWPSSMVESEMCLLNARLFPFAHAHRQVGLAEAMWLQGSAPWEEDHLEMWRSSWRLSLAEILDCVDMDAEFTWRRELFYEVECEHVRQTLLRRHAHGLQSLYKSACVEGYHQQMLDTLDQVACECDSPGIAARALGNIADVLGCLAQGRGGMRSGPAANAQWASAFELLENGDIVGGVKAMAVVRCDWLSCPSHLVRAARHYEGAAQILIRHAVMTARKFITTTPCEPAPMNKWVIAESPARADLSGGWSDTPPITYEHTQGGAVTNVALKIDGTRPVGAKVRRIKELVVILHIGGDDLMGKQIVLRKNEDLADYCKPHSPGALLKAAFCCSEILSYPCEFTLEEQLRCNHGGGFELQTWANLPHGSGLGTSSILAGVIMAALWRAAGRAFNTDSLLHAVLHLEQMLTTGGGWQDQIGGLVPGVKVGHSKGSLPLHVAVKPVQTDAAMLEALNRQLVLVYTGKTRLARNLLQNVIRKWYARDPETVSVCDQLVTNAWECASAIESGDLSAMGTCMDRYWVQKQHMAPGCEPSLVTRMLSALRPHIHGASMAGAGGGGFLYVLLKDGQDAVTRVRNILMDIEGAEHATVHEVSVDMEGLVCRLED